MNNLTGKDFNKYIFRNGLGIGLLSNELSYTQEFFTEIITEKREISKDFLKDITTFTTNNNLLPLNPNDEYLYHYTSMKSGIENILKNMTLKFSPLKDSREPMERFNPIYGITLIDGINLPDIGVNEFKKATETLKIESREKIKVACFCKDNHPFSHFYWDFGFNKIRMWDQYADLNRGLCLVFSKNEFIKSLDIAKDIGLYKAGDVDYDPENWEKSSENLFLDFSKLGKFKSYKNRYKHVLPMIFTKAPDFSGENEFRIAIRNNSNSPTYFPIKKILKQVILGIDFPQVYLPTVKELCQTNDVSLMQAKISPLRFKLSWVNI